MNFKNDLTIGSPRKTNIAMVFFLLYSTIFVQFFVASGILYFFKDKGSIIVPSLLGGQLFSFILPIAFYMIITKQNIKSTFNIKPISFINIVLVVIMTLSLIPFTMFLSALSSLFVQNDVSALMEALMQLNGGLPINLLIIAVTPAICEELFFRGVFLSGYKNVNLLTAAFVNGLYFGLMHLNLQQFLYAFLIGGVFAIFVHYTKSIFASMIAHFTLNASNVLLMEYVKNIENAGVTDLPNNLAFDPESFGFKLITIISIFFVSLIFLGLFVLIFNIFLKYNKSSFSQFLNQKLLSDINEEKELTSTSEPVKQKIFDRFFYINIVYYVVFMALSSALLYYVKINGM